MYGYKKDRRHLSGNRISTLAAIHTVVVRTIVASLLQAIYPAAMDARTNCTGTGTLSQENTLTPNPEPYANNSIRCEHV